MGSCLCKVVTFYHGQEPDGDPGRRRSRKTPAGTHSMTFIHTYKYWDDAPRQLFMLNSCLVSLQPLTMCKYFYIVNSLCIYPPCFIISVSQYVASIILVCLKCLPVFCWEYVNKLRLWYKGTLKYLRGSVTGMKIGLRKRWRGLDAFIVFEVWAWMPADVQTNSGNSDVHAQWFSHWKIRADNHDVISWHHEDFSCY